MPSGSPGVRRGPSAYPRPRLLRTIVKDRLNAEVFQIAKDEMMVWSTSSPDPADNPENFTTLAHSMRMLAERALAMAKFAEQCRDNPPQSRR